MNTIEELDEISLNAFAHIDIRLWKRLGELNAKSHVEPREMCCVLIEPCNYIDYNSLSLTDKIEFELNKKHY